MRLLLLGCTGFIGSELVPRLLRSGHQITIISRKKQRESKHYDSNSINFVTANPANPSCWGNSDLLKSLEKAEGVFSGNQLDEEYNNTVKGKFLEFNVELQSFIFSLIPVRTVLNFSTFVPLTFV